LFGPLATQLGILFVHHGHQVKRVAARTLAAPVVKLNTFPQPAAPEPFINDPVNILGSAVDGCLFVAAGVIPGTRINPA